MSGIEVLGLVLGGLPLLISAFEHFRDLCEAKDLILHFEAKHAKALAEVKDEQIIFRLHLKKLLLPLVKADVLAPDDVDELLLNPGGSKWQVAEVSKALKCRLGEVHTRYMEILEELPGILHKLLMMLGFKLPGGASSFQSKLKGEQDVNFSARFKLKIKANARFVGERVEFVTSKWCREDLLEELHQKLEKLDTFITRRDEVATLEQQNSLVISQQAIKALLQHWRHADRVYGLIYQRMGCQCKQSHCAHLWLQHQATSVFELKLLILFCSPARQLQGSHRWQPQGLQIRQTLEPSIAQTTPAKANVYKTVSSPTSYSSFVAETKKGALKSALSTKLKSSASQKRIAMSTDNVLNPAVSTTIESSQLPASPDELITKKKVRIDTIESRAGPTSASTAIREISDICEALANLGMENVCIGLLTDRKVGCSYQVMSQPRQKIVANETTLWDTLRPSHRPRVQRTIRFQLALKIASSHLKLQSTHWARKQWEAKDVRFPSLRGDTREVLYDSPYISTDFNDKMSADSNPRVGMDRSFTSLGIMLLELLFGETLEEHEFWQKITMPNTADLILRRTVAHVWAHAIKGELPGEPGRLFHNAVIWCLNESPSTLEGDEWRKDLADRVVLPLEKCCEWMEVKIS